MQATPWDRGGAGCHLSAPRQGEQSSSVQSRSGLFGLLEQSFLLLSFFQVIILLTTVYVIGGEVKFGTGAEWLSTAGGNINDGGSGKAVALYRYL